MVCIKPKFNTVVFSWANLVCQSS